MRTDRGAARRAESGEYLTTDDAIAGLYRNAAALEVLVERKSIPAEVDRDIVSTRVFRCYRRPGKVRDVVSSGADHAVSHSHHIRSEAVPVRGPGRRVWQKRPCSRHRNPINREPRRDACPPADRVDGRAV